nr:phage holin family protein [Maliibacterium massiliense]
MAFLARVAGCALSLCAAGLLFPGISSLGGVLWGTLMLTLLYTLLRPAMQAIIAPLNLVVLGLLTPITDALFVWWTSAWVGGLALSYGQSIVVALLISLCFVPYSCWKQRLLRPAGGYVQKA